MRYLRKLCLVALGWPLLACDPSEPSDEGQYWLQIDLVDNLATDSRRVLVGSKFELYIEDVIAEDEVDRDSGSLLCVVSSATGSLVKLDEQASMYRVESAGPGAVEFAAPSDSCPANDDILSELGPDRWSMRGVEASDAIGKWAVDIESALRAWDLHPGDAGAFPDVLGFPLDDIRVAARGSFALRPVLLDVHGGERSEIRWKDRDAFITVPANYQELATTVDEFGQVWKRSYLAGSLPADASFDPSITILDHSFELPTITAVPAEHITSLELVPVYLPSDEPERAWGLPVAVIAIARDGEGRRILSPPVEWSVTRGRLGYDEDELGSDDALAVNDCRDEPRKPQRRSATVEATLGDIVTSVELEWVALPSDTIDPGAEPCRSSACDCSTSESPRDSLLAMLALLGLGGLLRRHSSSRNAASSEAK